MKLKVIVLIIALLFWGHAFITYFDGSLFGETVFQEIARILCITNGILMGIFVLLVGILFKK